MIDPAALQRVPGGFHVQPLTATGGDEPPSRFCFFRAQNATADATPGYAARIVLRLNPDDLQVRTLTEVRQATGPR